MEWAQKCEMVAASNRGDTNLFKDIVIKNLNEFDNQAWDMFFTCIEITPDLIDANKEFYNQVMRVYNANEADIEISFRADLRAGFLSELLK